MTDDFRSDRMESPEGKGLARKAWEAYARTAGKLATGPVLGPSVMPLAKYLGINQTADLLGFWLMWQLEGGFEGLLGVGMTRSSIYRRIKRFRQVTGHHPDEYVMAGVTFDLAAYHRGPGGDSPAS